MNRSTRIRSLAATVVAVAALGVTSACQEDPDSGSSDSSSVSQTDDDAVTEDNDDEGSTSEELPDLVGEDLQSAQDAAQEAGFFSLDSEDASGENRFQMYDRNWVVCSQTPEPGSYDTSTQVLFTVVKEGEVC